MPRRNRILMYAGLLTVLALGIAAVIVTLLTPQPKRYEAREGRPLLEHDATEFRDDQVGLRFVPPAEWGMQVRSTEGPTHRRERMLVKYKRVLPQKPMAWMRVRVFDVPVEQTLAEYLNNRKPPEADWQANSNVDDTLTVGGQPAAKRTYAGPYDSDGRGGKAYQCILTAIRREGQVFEFAGTFAQSDAESLEQYRAVIDSVRFP